MVKSGMFFPQAFMNVEIIFLLGGAGGEPLTFRENVAAWHRFIIPQDGSGGGL